MGDSISPAPGNIAEEARNLVATLATCRSGMSHLDNGIEEQLAHYFGCVKFSERSAFFAALTSDKLKRRILEEEQRTLKLRNAVQRERNFELRGKLSQLFPGSERGNMSPASPIPATETPEYSFLSDIDMSVAYLKRKNSHSSFAPHDHPSIRDEFPNQRVSMKEALEDNNKTNPVMWKCEKDMIRYFHIPANNMNWVEEFMARYYREQKDDLNPLYKTVTRGQTDSKTRALLSPQFWRDLEIESLPRRHLRPRCFPISTEYSSTRPETDNVALFMPYLHWETGIGRLKTIPPWEAMDQSINFPIKVRYRDLLRQVFILALFLKEEMDAYTDKKMIENGVAIAPGLHPRRTLSQVSTYSAMMRSTTSRGIYWDQMAHRQTATPLRELHRFCFNWNLSSRACEYCDKRVAEIPRLVMVDQLWLWILDDNTITTCFPKMWGRCSSKSSNVERKIRERLSAIQRNDVYSVSDLALIVIEECTQIFFNATYVSDLQPKPLEAYSIAIGKLNHKQFIASEMFWETAFFTSKMLVDSRHYYSGLMRQMRKRLLDITPELALLRETRDVLDELSVMISIKRQTGAVLAVFVDCITVRTQPGLEAGSEMTLKKAKSLVSSIHSQTSDLSALKDEMEGILGKLKELIALKQQQAGVIEAQESFKQGEETLKQGGTLMLFTVVTIIFLPLSFFTGIFGMNAIEINDGNWSVEHILKFMGPISVGIITLSLSFGFNKTTRNAALKPINLARFLLNITVAWFLYHTPLFEYLKKYPMSRKITWKDREDKIISRWRWEALSKSRIRRERKIAEERSRAQFRRKSWMTAMRNRKA